MVPFARAELEQISRKMACNEYFGASLALSSPHDDTRLLKISVFVVCFSLKIPEKHHKNGDFEQEWQIFSGKALQKRKF